MVRVISTDGEKVTLRDVCDCIVDDITLTVEDLKRPIPYGMGGFILPQSICGVSVENDEVIVEALPTVADAVEWCRKVYFNKYNTKIEFSIVPVECGVEFEDADELVSVLVTGFETDSKLFVVPPCVTKLNIGVFENTSIETIKVYGDTTFGFDTSKCTNISKVMLPEGSLYDFDMNDFGSGVEISYFSKEED